MRAPLRVLASSCLALASVGCGRSESTSTPASFRQRPPSSAASPVGRTERVVPVEVPNRSPLTGPISELAPERVKLLLEAGADPNLRETDAPTAWPPLALAMRGRGGAVTYADEYKAQREMVDLLLAHGADSNARWCGDDDLPRCGENDGLTPLMYAAILGDEEVTALLLRHRANPALRDWRGLTATDYWGVKAKPASWCSPPRPNEPLPEDARFLIKGELWRDHSDEILEELNSGPDPDTSIEVVKDERVCEGAAVAYARLRTIDPTQTAPRSVVPLLVIRVGGVWLVYDLQVPDDVSETAVFSRSWRAIAWSTPPS